MVSIRNAHSTNSQNLQCPGCGATPARSMLTSTPKSQLQSTSNALATLLFPVTAVYGIFIYTRFLRPQRLSTLPKSSTGNYLSASVSCDPSVRHHAKPSLVLAKTENGSSTSRSRPLREELLRDYLGFNSNGLSSRSRRTALQVRSHLAYECRFRP